MTRYKHKPYDIIYLENSRTLPSPATQKDLLQGSRAGGWGSGVRGKHIFSEGENWESY